MGVFTGLYIVFLLFVSASADNTHNPADELVSVVNNNRTSHKLSSLADNPGLGCLALQYVKAYKGMCSEVDNKKPPSSQFTEVFAPNCGITANTLSKITGRLLGCQTKYVRPSEAFNILVDNSKSLEIIYSKNHTQVGAAVSGTDGGSPYFWCILFSDGLPNKTFVAQDGTTKVQRPGCYSGAKDECSGARVSNRFYWPQYISILIALALACLCL